eukprot:5571517-Prymnesium_polylepis.2
MAEPVLFEPASVGRAVMRVEANDAERAVEARLFYRCLQSREDSLAPSGEAVVPLRCGQQY